MENILNYSMNGHAQKRSTIAVAAEVDTKVKRMPRKYEDLSHKELIHRLGENPEDRQLCDEFYARYNAYISSVVVHKYRNSRLKRYIEPGDIVQEVYINLWKNDGKAFTDFRSDYENGVFKWLGTISYFTLLAKVENRPHLDFDNMPTEDRKKFVAELSVAREFNEEVNDCLQRLGKLRRQGFRDKIIFLLKAEGFSTEEIENYFDSLSGKRIAGICTEMKQALQDCLRKKGIDPIGK